MNGAHALLQGLVDAGVEFVFANLGTDHAPLIETLAQWRRIGRRAPRMVLCPHENVAMHMAIGYAQCTGRGQAVLVHVDAGTANAAMGAHNALRTRVPLLLVAGRAPYSSHGEALGTRDNYVHFVQEPYDQAALVRPYMKWEYPLPAAAIAREAVQRAHSVMMSEPCGPVYLTVARETLAEKLADDSPRAPACVPQARAGVDDAFVERLAARLLAAERPVLVTAYAGRDPRMPALLGELAELAGIRVVEFNPQHLNLAHDHPCHAGFQPAEVVRDADLGLLLDVDVPWIPRDTRLDPATYWVQVDCDPVKRHMPLWPFPANERVEAHGAMVVERLLHLLRRHGNDAWRERAARRTLDCAQQARSRREAAQAAARDPGGPGAINPHHLGAMLARHAGDEAIVVNEAIRNTGSVLAQLPRRHAGTWYANGGGGLGYSGGVALGVKLARPDRLVVQCVGDGSLYFNTPSATLAVARAERLPVLTVVYDNRGWAAVRDATLSVYPDGEARAQEDYLSRLPDVADFAQLARASGAHGERADDPAELDAALGRCVAAVRGGTPALLHARVKPF